MHSACRGPVRCLLRRFAASPGFGGRRGTSKAAGWSDSLLKYNFFAASRHIPISGKPVQVVSDPPIPALITHRIKSADDAAAGKADRMVVAAITNMIAAITASRARHMLAR